MSYTPISDTLRRAPLAVTNGLWDALVANDPAVYEFYEPGFEFNPATHGAGTAAREYRVMVLGGRDLTYTNALAVGVYAEATSGTQPVNIATSPWDTGSFSVTGAAAWYTDTLALETGPTFPSGVQELVVTVPAPGAGNLYVDAVRVAFSSGAPGAGIAYPSGYRSLDAAWDSGQPIATEPVSRLRTNAVRVARDRPVCVYVDANDTTLSGQAGVKGTPASVWDSVDNLTAWTWHGRGTVPRCDVTERLFRCYALVGLYSPSTRIAAASHGAALPQATINVDSTTGFTTGGAFVITLADGSREKISYTGTSATTFTGCTGGTGTMSTGDRVGDDDYTSVRIGGHEEQWSGPGWHTWQVRLSPHEHEITTMVRPGIGHKMQVSTLQVFRTEL